MNEYVLYYTMNTYLDCTADSLWLLLLWVRSLPYQSSQSSLSFFPVSVLSLWSKIPIIYILVYILRQRESPAVVNYRCNSNCLLVRGGCNKIRVCCWIRRCVCCGNKKISLMIMLWRRQVCADDDDVCDVMSAMMSHPDVIGVIW
jgi:hypothetical protein